MINAQQAYDVASRQEVADNTKPSFAQALAKGLAGVQQNCLAGYLYGEPHYAGDPVDGARYFDAILTDCPAYYVQKEEAELVREYSADIAALLPKNSTIIEMGPGPLCSVEKKTLPLIAQIDPDAYFCVDTCDEYNHATVTFLNKHFPNIASNSLLADFFVPDLSFVGVEGRVGVCFGGTLLNITPVKTENFLQALTRHLAIWSTTIGQNGYLLITQDLNQDEGDLLAAYKNPENEVFIRNVLHRVQRDLRTGNWSAEAWEHSVNWKKNHGRLDIGFISKYNQSLMLDKQQYAVQEGQYMHVVSSYKIPELNFIYAAKAAGMKLIKTFKQANNRHCLHLFRIERVPSYAAANQNLAS
jgi:uncharacterized SAM-dependent methyltransferase